ncbi:MAG: hypothetical protein Q4C77_05990 [Eubacteriales bacterium]|nr:hypothetical protein [Eubacteriales bacterium]
MTGCKKKNKGKVHNIKLIRNNNQAQQCSFEYTAELETYSDNKNVFFMLDYFDFMEQTELTEEDQGYIAFCDMIEDVNHKHGLGISSKVIGLYQLQNSVQFARESGKTVFSLPDPSERKEKKALSEKPFLGIVQIFICDYNSAKECNGVEDVEQVLTEYENKIIGVLDKRNEPEKIKAEYNLYRSIAAADFCLVIRSARLMQIYEMVTEVLNIKGEYLDSRNEKKIVRMFNTYTNIGIECVRLTQQYLTFSENVIRENQNTKFAIRFSFNTDFHEQIEQLKKCGTDKVDVVNGLFGRYDAVVRVTMDDFADLYPCLCKNKMGTEFTALEREEILRLFASKDPLVKQLVEGLMDHKLRAVNERALLGIHEYEFNEEESKAETGSEWISFVNKKNQEVSARYHEIIKKYKGNFLYRKNSFFNVYNLLGKVIESYETLGFEQDTHINWYICTGYFLELFDKMEYYLESMEDNDDERKKFINELQCYVKAMSEYTRLLQAVNQHTIQAPQYDVIAPMDAEKFLIAYSEYMHSLDKMHYSYPWKKRENVCRENRKKCSVVIYPEMSKSKLELTEVIARDCRLYSEEENRFSSLLVCTLPSFEYFERPYDMIPLISHEMFHHVLVLNRRDRNLFMIERSIEVIFKRISYKMNVKAMGETAYVTYSYFMDLFADIFTKFFLEAYKEQNEEWENYVMTHIRTSILLFFQDMLGQEEKKYGYLENDFYASDYYNHEQVNFQGKDDACKFLMNTVKMEYSGADAKEMSGKAGALVKKIAELERMTESEVKDAFAIETMAEVENVIDMLMEKCGENIENEYKVRYDDLKSANSKERDSLIYDRAAAFLHEQTSGKDELKDYYEKIRLIHRNLCGLMDYIRFCSKSKKTYENIIQSALTELRQEIINIYEKSDYPEYYIYGQEERSILNYWNVLLENPKKAMDQILLFFQNEGFEEYDAIAKREMIIYRETCADIFMCKYMKMSSFGYLRMAVSIWGRMGGYEGEMNAGFVLSERIKNVLSVLLINEGVMVKNKEWMGKMYIEIPVESLYKEISKYRENSLNQAERKLRNAIEKENKGNTSILEQFDDYFSRIKVTLEYMQGCAESGGRVIVEGSPLEELYMKNETQFGKGSKLKRYLQSAMNVFLRIIHILRAVAENQRNGVLTIEKTVYEHYKMIYDNPKPEQGGESDLFAENVHETVGKVSAFYNDPESEGKEDTTNRDKLNQMIRFVQDYYYYNRICRNTDEMYELEGEKEV